MQGGQDVGAGRVEFKGGERQVFWEEECEVARGRVDEIFRR